MVSGIQCFLIQELLIFKVNTFICLEEDEWEWEEEEEVPVILLVFLSSCLLENRLCSANPIVTFHSCKKRKTTKIPLFPGVTVYSPK